MRNDWNAAKISGGATLKGGALNQGFKYWIWGRRIGLMVGKSRRRRTELEKKAMKKKKTEKLSQKFHMGEHKNFKRWERRSRKEIKVDGRR